MSKNMQYFLKEEIIKNILNEPIRSQLSTETKPLCHIIQHHHLLLPKLQILGTCHQKKLNLVLSKQANQEGKLAVFLSLRYTQSLWWKEEMLLCWIPSRTKWLNVPLDGERKYSLEKEFWTTVFLKKFSSFILKVTSATKQLLKMCHLREAKVKNFFVSSKSYVPSLRYSSFFIFNHPLIYQICDVMMSINISSTSDGTFLNISFEPQLINRSNLVNWYQSKGNIFLESFEWFGGLGPSSRSFLI